eukprot:10444751-Alexandrium_andersonii.AAC.1
MTPLHPSVRRLFPCSPSFRGIHPMMGGPSCSLRWRAMQRTKIPEVPERASKAPTWESGTFAKPLTAMARPFSSF